MTPCCTKTHMCMQQSATSKPRATGPPTMTSACKDLKRVSQILASGTRILGILSAKTLQFYPEALLLGLPELSTAKAAKQQPGMTTRGHFLMLQIFWAKLLSFSPPSRLTMERTPQDMHGIPAMAPCHLMVLSAILSCFGGEDSSLRAWLDVGTNL